ncbi:cytochrome c4 [Tepidimonas taiwanensis]|uniref:Cytochrome c4 n=1 Tax=Tepidimonas taiwanensis TaxID=307486 RepID=A0A554X522_9BURK|nr:c-type cytochrome [Tepidimonas taiwanensis]TSE30932.1 Cytochrome c4 [Tepidimonas taiwanensis]UBQ05856.1 cytochrome c4 [Tepidimonas taiwanensis]
MKRIRTLPPIRHGWRAVVVAGTLAAVAGASWAQADDARARKIANGVCAMCHGDQGESASEIFPRLAGQHAEYITKQLRAFKSGERKSTAMAEMVARLTDDEMVALGRYYEKLPPVRDNVKDTGLAAIGAYLYQNGNKFSGVPACAACHGPDGHGAANLPRLAGQLSGYLFTQLKQFNQRQRTNDNVVMHAVAEKMTELEMAAVAEYLSTK